MNKTSSMVLLMALVLTISLVAEGNFHYSRGWGSGGSGLRKISASVQKRLALDDSDSDGSDSSEVDWHGLWMAMNNRVRASSLPKVKIDSESKA